MVGISIWESVSFVATFVSAHDLTQVLSLSIGNTELETFYGSRSGAESSLKANFDE